MKDASQINDLPLGFSAWSVLDDLGVGLVDKEPDVFDQLVDQFGVNFPTTAEFSRFARDTLDGPDALRFPDEAWSHGWITKRRCSGTWNAMW